MTYFLASVASLAEAEIALASGADIVDCKDPARGALGALPLAEVVAINRALSGRKPVSAVIGDLPVQPDVVLREAQAMAATGVDYIKVGLFPGPQRAACIAALAPLAASHKIIGVLFADAVPDLALLPLMAASGFAGAMLDTAGKGAGRLMTHMEMPALGVFVTACKAQGLMSGLAGSLEPPDVPRLLALGPDFLGFRGALCKDRVRGGALDPASIALVRSLIPLAGAVHANAAPGGATDCIFVSDLTVPLRIGAYAFEHLAPQNVRFNVEADVQRLAEAGDSMPDVFSYDLIIDGIRLLAASTAFAMVETLAERVAAQVLAHARVARVRVKVEKLDLGDFRVGVAIERVRGHARPAGEGHT